MKKKKAWAGKKVSLGKVRGSHRTGSCGQGCDGDSGGSVFEMGARPNWKEGAPGEKKRVTYR